MDQLSKLELESMIVSEYKVTFHKLSFHTTMILPIEEERVWCFIRGLRLYPQLENQSFVSVGRYFLAKFIMNILWRIFIVMHKVEDKRGLVGNYIEPHPRFRDYHDMIE